MAGVSICPDCGLELVAELPRPRPTSPAQPVEEKQLCTVQGEIHAKLLCDALGSQGIATRVASGWPFDGLYEALRPPPPIGSAANAVFRIHVRAEDLRRALTVYRDLELAPLALPDECDTPDDS
jgi:hypothetical protein